MMKHVIEDFLSGKDYLEIIFKNMDADLFSINLSKVEKIQSIYPFVVSSGEFSDFIKQRTYDYHDSQLEVNVCVIQQKQFNYNKPSKMFSGYMIHNVLLIISPIDPSEYVKRLTNIEITYTF
jgi:hypothetical protein